MNNYKISSMLLITILIFTMTSFSSGLAYGSELDDGSGSAESEINLQQSVESLNAEPVVQGDGIVSYAAWNNGLGSKVAYVYIYPLEDDTNIELWATSSTSAPIQITSIVASWANAQGGEPIAFGPLTNQQYFFKLKTDKPVTWELNTSSYQSLRDSSRFVIATSLNYLGSEFYFHADNASGEEVNVVNPGPGNSGFVELSRWDGILWVPVGNLANISADNYGEFSVPENAFYKITSENPVLVYEGRLHNQHMATGVTAEGDTAGSTIYAATLYETFAGAGARTTLHIMGVTNASYTVYQRTPATSWTVAATGSVALGGIAYETNLPDDMLFKVETSIPEETVCVQYVVSGSSTSARGGSEMIPGIDGGDTTNPGTEFIMQFGGSHLTGSYTYQKYIDIIAPTAGTEITINGPAPAAFTTTVDNECIHYAPGDSNTGLYTVNSTNPIWVVIVSNLGDQGGYFVYNATSKTVPIDVDIRPRSCPNPLRVNFRGKGVLPVAILGSDDFNVFDIDIATITLEGVSPIRSSFEDVATPFDGEECECSTEEPDGILDLTLKFSRADILTALEATYGDLTKLPNRAEIPLTLLATLMDEGTPVEGKDCLRILNKGTIKRKK